jgi:hypothetical protein
MRRRLIALYVSAAGIATLATAAAASAASWIK